MRSDVSPGADGSMNDGKVRFYDNEAMANEIPSDSGLAGNIHVDISQR